MESEDAEEFSSIVAAAQRLIDQGDPEGVLRVRSPIPQFFSAASYLDKHGPEEKCNLVRLAGGIRVPILTLNGSLETHTRLLDMAQDLAAAAVNSPQAATLMIDQGEHSLVNRMAEASEAVLKWLAALAPQEVAV